MEKTVLIEQTAKKIKLAELIVLMCLFGSIAAGFGLMYLWFPLGIAMFCIAGVAFLAFCYVFLMEYIEQGQETPYYEEYHKQRLYI